MALALTLALTLASTSPTRRALLERAGFVVTAIAPRLDEDAMRQSLLAEAATPRDIADALAEAKAAKVAGRTAGLVLGADQILVCEGALFTKPADREDAARHLTRLQGRAHKLLSAVVCYRDAAPVWRHVAEATLTMRTLSPAQIDAYLARAWPDVAGAVGCYQVEGTGIALFREIRGEHTAILGLPLPPLMAWLEDSGVLS